MKTEKHKQRVRKGVAEFTNEDLRDELRRRHEVDHPQPGITISGPCNAGTTDDQKLPEAQEEGS